MSQTTTAPSDPPDASRVAAAPPRADPDRSNTTQRTGLDPCPFKTSGSRVTNSSAPAPPSSACRREWTRPKLDDADDEDDEAAAAAATSDDDRSKIRTVPSDQPVATLQSPSEPSPADERQTSRHVTSSPLSARPLPTPPEGLSR